MDCLTYDLDTDSLESLEKVTGNVIGSDVHHYIFGNTMINLIANVNRSFFITCLDTGNTSEMYNIRGNTWCFYDNEIHVVEENKIFRYLLDSKEFVIDVPNGHIINRLLYSSGDEVIGEVISECQHSLLYFNKRGTSHIIRTRRTFDSAVKVGDVFYIKIIAGGFLRLTVNDVEYSSKFINFKQEITIGKETLKLEYIDTRVENVIYSNEENKVIFSFGKAVESLIDPPKCNLESTLMPMLIIRNKSKLVIEPLVYNNYMILTVYMGKLSGYYRKSLPSKDKSAKFIQ